MSFFSRIFSKTVTTIDDISTGKIDPIEEIQRSFDEVKGSVGESLQGSFSGPKEMGSKKNGDAGSSNTAEQQRAKADQEALAALREFQKGSKGKK